MARPPRRAPLSPSCAAGGTVGKQRGVAWVSSSSHLLILIAALGLSAVASADTLPFEDGPRAILAAKCFACHGADRTKRKADLDLQTAESIRKGGESGPAIVPGKTKESLLWEKISTQEMPPEGNKPLTADELAKIEAWIAGGAISKLSQRDGALADKDRDFWSFRRLVRPKLPQVKNTERAATPLDRFVLARLESKGLSLAAQADRRTLVRRLYLDLIGLPPTPAQVDAFLNDRAPDAYARLVDALLASPRYGERWGRQWLDVVGYADSNGFHRADSPRPLAYRYRDYVIQSLNDDKPYDQFWVEQLAGDELVNYPAVETLSDRQREMLIATHYLRNAPDGTDSTEGNETARTIERYAVLESQLQITMSAMFGMTIECARCHSHKFDPIPQTDYYALQAVFYPAFNVKEWVQPKDRWIHAAGRAEIARWKASNAETDRKLARLDSDFENWLSTHRPPGAVRFRDEFSRTSIVSNWNNAAPGDSADAMAAHLDGETGPAARADGGHLLLLAAAGRKGSPISTRQSFDWTPAELGNWIQATFDLVDDHVLDGKPAERIGYFIALHDYDDTSKVAGGNLLLDGSPAGGASLTLDYPGRDKKSLGTFGAIGYAPGHNYGVRVTRVSKNDLLLQHLVDGQVDGVARRLSAKRLPDGGFGFELIGNRSFVVDNVVVESSLTTSEQNGGASQSQSIARQVREMDRKLRRDSAKVESERMAEPEKIAWATDVSDHPPEVHLLKRGDYFQPGAVVQPGTLSVLVDADNAMHVEPPPSGAKTTGSRLAFARWATKPKSRAAALLARVQIDRLWRGHFGQGLVPTPENFGASGMPPTHPELLEWLAAELIENGWHCKAIHRQIVMSAAYRQSDGADELAIERDPDDALYSRFPVHRLEAEAIRDCMLAVAGQINLKAGGPAVEFIDRGNRQIVLPPPKGAGPQEVNRRSIYVRQRRTQPLSFLQAFGQAAAEPNCVARPVATVVAQSLAMLNGDFAVRMGQEFAARLERETASAEGTPAEGLTAERAQIRQAFQIALMREPSDAELERCAQFLRKQIAVRGDADPKAVDPKAARRAALADFCRMLLATSEFVYMP
jgi:Protein of unknown function (DUF1549)/Protein of unknown function (DUF1553)/Planctomycete cytochrome C